MAQGRNIDEVPLILGAVSVMETKNFEFGCCTSESFAESITLISLCFQEYYSWSFTIAPWFLSIKAKVLRCDAFSMIADPDY